MKSLPIYLKAGLIAGTISVIYFLGLFVTQKSLIFNPFFYNLSTLFVIVAMYVVANRMSLSASTTFKQLLRAVFVTYIVATILFYICYFLMHTLDPNFAVLHQQQIIQGLQTLRDNSKDMSEIQYYNELIKVTEQEQNSKISLAQYLMQIGRSLIGGFLLSYLITFLIQRRK
jgi:hypothetical protein